VVPLEPVAIAINHGLLLSDANKQCYVTTVIITASHSVVSCQMTVQHAASRRDADRSLAWWLEWIA